MAKKKKSKSLNFELIIIGVFFFSFIVWSTSKCNAKRRSYRQQEEQAAQLESTKKDSTTVVDVPQQEPTPKTATPKSKPSTPNLTRLYVRINGLNLRKEPSLNAEVVTKLNKGTQVYFLNEVTDFTTKVAMEDKTEVEKPWVKVKTKNGLRGWVFGAYVDYYVK